MSDKKVIVVQGWEQHNEIVDRVKSGDGGGGDMQSRIAKLESSVEYIQRDITDIKDDIKGIRTELKEQRELHHKDFRIMFGALIAVALGLAGLMAKGFSWL